jgi:hypothetical protein
LSFWQHETSFHRYHQSRILRRSQFRLWFLRAIRLLKTSHKQLCPNRFLKAQNEEKRSNAFDKWNIDSSTSPKWQFKTFTKQIMSS